MDMYLTSEEKPHISFLEERGYMPINPNKTKWKKYLVFIGLSKDETRCIIIRRNKIKVERMLEGDNTRIYDVVYMGRNPFDIPEFSRILFDKLRLNYIPSKKKQLDRMIKVSELDVHDEEEDIDTILNW